MTRKGIGIVAGIILLAGPALLAGAEKHYRVVGQAEPFYYGHISYTEATEEGNDPVVVRAGGEIRPAVLNLPVGPGDVIRTPADRRCEIQFDTGTLVRLDVETELRIETVLAPALSTRDRLTNLVLERGQVYVMYRHYDRREIFQLLTPEAAIKMKNDSVAVARTLGGSTDLQVDRGRVSVLYGPAAAVPAAADVVRGRRLIVLRDGHVQDAEPIAETDFRLWNEKINAEFETLHEGAVLPKPIQKLPGAVFDFAQKFGDVYGEWIWDNLYGYVWRPHYERYYPGGSWQPYIHGRWETVGRDMFWIPEEPWGWVPYHLGIWQWDEKLGWVWLPGSAFAPAWVAWDFFFGYHAWRPWGMMDWYWSDYWFDYYGQYLYQPFGFTVAGGTWGYNWWQAHDAAYRVDGRALPAPVTVIRKDQLKKPTGAALPRPADLNDAYKKVIAGWKAGYPRLTESLKAGPSHLVLVRREDIHAPDLRGRQVPFSKVSRIDAAAAIGERQAFDPAGEAARSFRANEARAVAGRGHVPERLPAGPPVRREAAAEPGRTDTRPADAGGTVARRPTGVERPSPGAPEAGRLRLRDWNPDVKIAHAQGFGLRYRSDRNEVYCPDLDLSSRQARITSRRGVESGGFDSGSPGFGGGTASSPSGASSGGQGGAASAGARSSGGSGDRGTRSEGGTTRK